MMRQRTGTNAVVGTYPSYRVAQVAIRELESSGFNTDTLSIFGRDPHADVRVVGYYNAGDRIRVWAKRGIFWGGILGWLFGSGFLLAPGLGPLALAGPAVGWIVGAVQGAVVFGGLGAIAGGIVSTGIPNNTILKYETALRSGRVLLIAYSSQEEIARAKAILDGTPKERVHLELSGASLQTQITFGNTEPG